MTIANYMVVSMDPDGAMPNISFYGDSAAAEDRAQHISRDLGRDVFVTDILSRHYGSREVWRQYHQIQDEPSDKATEQAYHPEEKRSFVPRRLTNLVNRWIGSLLS